MKDSFESEADMLFNPGKRIRITIRHAKAQRSPKIIFILFILSEDMIK
jgi:hypothetical protein